MDETGFIHALQALATHDAARGLADDCAVLEFGGEALVLTQDTLVEGVHFPAGWDDPADIAWKLVAVNLSDLAAKGARPVGILLSHALGKGDDRFLDGLGEALARYDVPLVGGDTVAMPEGAARSWTITALGRATHLPVPSRAGAKPGDAIWLVGRIGDAYRGFDLLGEERRRALLGLPPSDRPVPRKNEFVQAYLRPEPLIEEGIALAPHASAMMDVSDGLLLDLSRIARASGVACVLDDHAVPMDEGWFGPSREADEAEGFAAVREGLLRWGDDYALLFTAPPDAELPLEAARIGVVTKAGEHPLLYASTGEPPDEPLGYTHDPTD